MASSMKTKSSRRRSKRSRSNLYHLNKELLPNVASCPTSIWSLFGPASRQQDLHTVLMSRDDVLITDGSGQLATVYSNDPSVSSAWGSLAGIYDEYRVLAFRLDVMPSDIIGGSASTIRQAIAVVTDYDTSAPLTGYTLANQYSSCKEFQPGKKFSYRAYMSGFENSQYISTGSASPTFWVKLWSSGNTTSLKAANARAVWVVQFRGKGI